MIKGRWDLLPNQCRKYGVNARRLLSTRQRSRVHKKDGDRPLHPSGRPANSSTQSNLCVFPTAGRKRNTWAGVRNKKKERTCTRTHGVGGGWNNYCCAHTRKKPEAKKILFSNPSFRSEIGGASATKIRQTPRNKLLLAPGRGLHVVPIKNNQTTCSFPSSLIRAEVGPQCGGGGRRKKVASKFEI